MPQSPDDISLNGGSEPEEEEEDSPSKKTERNRRRRKNRKDRMRNLEGEVGELRDKLQFALIDARNKLRNNQLRTDNYRPYRRNDRYYPRNSA